MGFSWWLRNIPGYDELHRDPSPLFGTSDPARRAALAKELSMIYLVSEDDPPTFMRYGMAPDDPVPTGDRARGWKVHHVNFGLALKEKLDQLGIENDLLYPGAVSRYKSVGDFFIRKFELR